MTTAPLRRGASTVARLLPALSCIVLASVFAMGVCARFSVPNVPIADFDTPGYLSPALSWLKGDGFLQAAGRDWLYPAFLAFVLKTTGSFSALAVSQKFLGLGAVLLLMAAWHLWVSMLKLPGVWQCLALLAGAIPAYYQACNSLAVFFELRLRPEAILPFFAFAQLFCILAYCRYRWLFPRPGLSLLFGALSIVLAYASCLLKPSWLFALGTTTLPVFIGLFGSFSRPVRLLTPVCGLLLAALLLWLPAKILLIPDRASRTFLPSTLLTIHVKPIMATLAKQASKLPAGDPHKEQLQNILAAFGREFPVAVSRPGTYEQLGYDPDYLYYKSSLMPVIWQNSGRSDEGLRAFCFRAYFDTFRDQPLVMAGKIATQFSFFLFPDSNSFYRSRIELNDAYKSALEAFKYTEPAVKTPETEMCRKYHDDLSAFATSAPLLNPRTPARFIAGIANSLGFSIEILFLIALAVVHFWSPLHRFRFAGWAALLILSAPAANALTIAVVHTLDNSRYRQSYSTFVVFALTALAVFIVVTLAGSIHHAMRKFIRR